MDKDQILEETTLSLAFFDGFPLTPGHILVVPRRHAASFFALSPAEQADLIQLANRCKILLDEKYDPAGYNLGINDGSLAGQTVPHVHLHLIPRYEGDVEDPRGGIRWVIPEKAVYWEDEKE